MDPTRRDPKPRNAGPAETKCGTDTDEVYMKLEANNDRLEKIVRDMQLLNERKKEAWRQGEKLKAEFDAQRKAFEQKMLDVGKIFHSRPPLPDVSRVALDFSDSDGGKEIALCLNEDSTAGDMTNSFESAGTAWLTSEIMGFSTTAAEDEEFQKLRQDFNELSPRT